MLKQIRPVRDQEAKHGSLKREKHFLNNRDATKLAFQELSTPEDLHELFAGTEEVDIGSLGHIEDLAPPTATLSSEAQDATEDEELEPELAPGSPEESADPVRLYLREIGRVPLLDREAELRICKRIERGQLRVLRAL